MAFVLFEDLKIFITALLAGLGVPEENAAAAARVYIQATKRGAGHHDVTMLPMRIQALREGRINPKPQPKLLASFGGMERWDADNGLGEVVNTFSMQRAVDLASKHGIGFCALCNSNHFLCSAPYVAQAAERGYIGLIISKGAPTMGVPGSPRSVIGQSPIGYAFPTEAQWPVLLDISLAYASGLALMERAKTGTPVPPWWGADPRGQPTTDAEALLKGVRYPIGEHKGFGLAILCELLTGVLSGGRILDENEEEEFKYARSPAHTTIAIKTDALMTESEYLSRSNELIDRIRGRWEGVRIPGQSSWEKRRAMEAAGGVELSDSLIDVLNGYAGECGAVPISGLYHK